MDKIIIENLVVFARHGVCQEEQVLGQKFLVSAVLYTNTQMAGLSDELSGTIDYGKVCQFITDYMSKNTFRLIETVAEYIARELLIKFSPMLHGVKVTIKKPWAPVGLPLDCCSVEIYRRWHTAYLSLGSNMGDRRNYLKNAVSELKKHKLTRVTKQSSLIETKPYGNTDQDDFLNGCVELKTLLSPEELLSLCHSIEKNAGRERKVHWGPRTLDLDIILYDDIVLDSREPNLIIPHADMKNRRFVLEPLNEIAPGVVHPLYGESIRVMYERLLKEEE